MSRSVWWVVVLGTLAGSGVAAEVAAEVAVKVASEVVKFADLQGACVAGGSLGPAALADCRMTRSRWVSTIGNLDFYQAQYCLGAGCRQRALRIYSNRAYAAEAQILIERVDPAGTEYVDPLVIAGPDGPHLVVRWRSPGGGDERAVYRWQDARWQPVDARKWQGEIPD